jgi:hypothetical protein
MTDKTEGPAKDAGRAGEDSGVKRPHATLDLKATDVTAPTPPPSATASSSSSSSAASDAADKKPADAKSSAASQASAAKPAGPGGGPAAPSYKPHAEAPKASPPPRAPSGASRFLSLLAAGAVGGALVYAGGAWLPQSGLAPLFGAGDATKQLEARLAALEFKQQEAAQSPQLAEKVSDAESRLGKLEAMRSEIASLNDAHTKLANDTKALSDKVGTGQADEQDRDRVVKLEDRLNVMAAGAPGPDGRLPQLAAISGKIADLETALNTQIASVRKSIPVDMDARIQASAEASEAARSGTQRLDRDLSQLRSDLTRITQRQEVSKADTDRLAATLQSAQEQVAKIESSMGELRTSAAKPADVSAAVAPVASKVAALEQNLAGVVKGDDDRKANAERIVLSLELSNLKRALDRGHGYATELAEVRKAANGKLELGPLERFKETGVPTLATLDGEFQPLINQVIDADMEPADGSIVDRMLAGAKSIVRVRKVGQDAGDNSAEAIVGRIEDAVQSGRLGVVLEQAKLLPARAAQPLQDWLQKVNARYAVDTAMASIEGQLKASLSGNVAPPAGKEVN